MPISAPSSAKRLPFRLNINLNLFTHSIEKFTIDSDRPFALGPYDSRFECLMDVAHANETLCLAYYLPTSGVV